MAKKTQGNFKILFITRKFPPSIGGMQTVAYELYTQFCKNNEVSLISLRGSQRWLPLFIPYAFIKSVSRIMRDKPDVVYIADGLLSPLGAVLKYIFNLKVICTIHGLDITYSNKLYQLIIPRFANSLDKIICVSNATKYECLKRSIEEAKCIVIPNGINPVKLLTKTQKKELRKRMILKLKIKNSSPYLIITLGRLVKRKGHEWFISNVMSKLPMKYYYIVAGDGPEKENIINAVKLNNLENRVMILGQVTELEKDNLLNSVDMMVMPNIKVDGDMEGFGVVALEALIHKLPVLTSNIEGLADVSNIKNYRDYCSISKDEFVKRIMGVHTISTNGSVMQNLNWENISNIYLSYFRL